MAKVSIERQDDGGYLVREDGDRIGFVRQVGKKWHAADTHFVGIRHPYKTRANAVAGLIRRARKTTS